ncbi:MAG: hypothetical protein QM724_11435 [Flavobacteriales bacterium]
MKTLTTLLAGLSLTVAVHAQSLVDQTFYANGRIQSTRFSDGRVERFITYYADGRVQAMGGYRDGRRDGVWRQFDERGTVLAEARFANGKRTGTWEFRDADNALKGRLHYNEGRLSAGEQYADGALIAQRGY